MNRAVVNHAPTTENRPAIRRPYTRTVELAVEKMFWLIVFWLAGLFVVNWAGGDLKNPTVFVTTLAVTTVIALGLTWGDGKQTD
jgi:hypothetical protein